ncbi:uncharacterized protein LOC135471530 [Liolophura sinensis]|uniref:uncharacterized protein LOC135471530 n=1 Tax=Liolophura sinensis TaxID=3198878 RepID=UPI003158737B
MEWMYSRLLELTTVATILFLLTQKGATVTCPRDMFSSVFACFRDILGPNAQELIVAGADLRAVKARCEDGSFNKAVGCVQNLNHVCRYSERQALLSRLANTVLMDEGFKVFCDNLFRYGENKECLLRKNTVIQRCIEYRQGIFDYEMSVNREDETATMETVCNFLRGMTGCIDLPVRNSCDSVLADILLKFMSGITPPVCEPYHPTNDAYSPYSLITNTTYWISFLFTMSCLLNFNFDLVVWFPER